MVRHPRGSVPRVDNKGALGDDHVIVNSAIVGHNQRAIVRPERFSGQRDGLQTEVVFPHLPQTRNIGAVIATATVSTVRSMSIVARAVLKRSSKAYPPFSTHGAGSVGNKRASSRSNTTWRRTRTTSDNPRERQYTRKRGTFLIGNLESRGSRVYDDDRVKTENGYSDNLRFWRSARSD